MVESEGHSWVAASLVNREGAFAKPKMEELAGAPVFPL
jgi:hypothetical protein